jgi:hypothetical protein
VGESPGPLRPRFFDGGTDEEPPDPTRRPAVLLDRRVEESTEVFALGRRIGYADAELGDLLVPADLATFRTDLTSVPSVFGWLVPRTGQHLPAALVHDGLVHPRGTAPTYLSVEGHDVDRVAADRVLRSAMRDSRTPLLRRWLVWSAVSLATIAAGSTRWSRARHLRHLVPAVLSLLLVAGTGVVATLDLLDVVDVLPWMGERSWPVEVAGGFAAAVVLPGVLGLTWGRPFTVAGVVTLVALALLLHVTVAVGLLTLAYQAAERLVAVALEVAPRRSQRSA